ISRTLALKLATIYEEALGDAARAVDKLRAALDLPGDERGPLEALDRLLDSLGRWEELGEVLERAAQVSLDAAEQCGDLHRLGQLRAEKLSDLEGAIGAWQKVLERDAGHDLATAGLLKALEDPAVRSQAIDILEPVFEAQGDAPHLLRVLEVK